MEQIKYLDLKPYGKLAGKLNVAYDRVFNSGTYIGGKEIDAFEQEWAEYNEVKYCVGVGNGYDALYLSCKYFTRYYDYPIDAYIPWKTCLPTWAAATNAGFKGNPTKVNDNYSIAVHIYGQITIPKDHKGTLIEDCAQAHGAKIYGTKAGCFGRVAAWSFYPTKNLGALGDAGAVTTNDEEIYGFVKYAHTYGSQEYPGINSRLDPLQAAFLRVKLKFLDEWNEQRKANAQSYFDNIIPGAKVKLPYTKNKYDEPCWHIFAIEVDDRYELRKFLLENGVETMVHYPEVPYSSDFKVSKAEKWARTTLSLPVSPHVTPYLCNRIANLINQWMGA